MKKFILKQTGKEVKMGDELIKECTIKTSLGKGHFMETIVVDESTLPKLIEEGVIVSIGCAENSCACKENTREIPMNPNFYIRKIAERMGWHNNKIGNYLDTLSLISLPSVFSVLLREIAVELDKKYENHIQDSPEIYVVSMFDGKITKANKALIKNYKNFAAFRSIEDAKIACKILKPILRDMFKGVNGKQ